MNPYHDHLGRFTTAENASRCPFPIFICNSLDYLDNPDSDPDDLDLSDPVQVRARLDEIRAELKPYADKAAARFQKAHAKILNDDSGDYEVISYMDLDTREFRFAVFSVDYIMEYTAANSGMTYDISTNTCATDGYAVADFTNRAGAIEDEIFEKDPDAAKVQIKAFIEENRDALTLGSHYMGTWYSKGTLCLDISERVVDREEAIQLGRTRNQIAIYDLETGEEILTGGTGETSEATQGVFS